MRFRSPVWLASLAPPLVLKVVYYFYESRSTPSIYQTCAKHQKKYSASEEKLRKAGVKRPDPALVFTAAKYYDCLNRLAKETIKVAFAGGRSIHAFGAISIIV